MIYCKLQVNELDVLNVKININFSHSTAYRSRLKRLCQQNDVKMIYIIANFVQLLISVMCLKTIRR